MERNYIAFISYRHMPLDMAVAKKLHSLIEQYGIPKDLRKGSGRKLGIVFRDQEELAASSDLSRDIREALDHSKYLIVVCSRDTPTSPWVAREITYFLQEHPREHVLTVLISGEPAEAFPEILTASVDGTRNIEPLAVDIRASSVSRTLSRLKKESLRLFAAMLGCPYDALVLRDQKRQFRKVGIAAGTAAVVAASFISLLWLKNGQIEKQNQELASQKAQLEYSQSQLLYTQSKLLTEDAEEALANRDYMTAIQNAVEALPLENEEGRAYYAPAESALMEAMGVFAASEDNGIRRQTVLEQSTPVRCFRIIDEAKRAVTMDDYGTVNCFNTETGQIQWSFYIQGSQDSNAVPTNQMFLRGDRKSLICCYRGSLVCFDIASGKQLWKSEISDMAENSFFYHEKQDILVYIDYVPGDQEEHYCGELVILSGETGEPLKSLLVSQEAWFVSDGLFDVEMVHLCGGVFSEDGGVFAGVFLRDTGDYEKSELGCFASDLDNGTAKVLYTGIFAQWNSNYQAAIQFTNQDSALLLALDSSGETDYLLKLDRLEGTALWCEEIPGNPLDNAAFLLPWNSSFLAVTGSMIHRVNLEEGVLEDTVELPAAVTSLQALTDRCFGISTQDGTYGCGWLSDGKVILTANRDSPITVAVGQHSQIQIQGKGVLQFNTDGTSFMDASVGNVGDEEGYLAMVPLVQNNTVVCIRPATHRKMINTATVESTVGDIESLENGTDFHAVFCRDALILGPVQVFHRVDMGNDLYAVIDTGSHQVTKIISVPDRLLGSTITFLPDASGYIECTWDGDVIQGKGGTEHFLSGKSASGETDWSGNICSGSVPLHGSGDVLTARYQSKDLTVWRNGGAQKQTTIPEGHAETWYSRFMKMGANGNILVCAYDNTLVCKTSDFRVYDTNHQTWTKMEGCTAIPNPDAVSVSNVQAYCAVVDEQDNAWILDIPSSQVISSFPLQLPHDSIASTSFILNDTCLMVQTRDNLILAFDIATGTLLFRDTLSCSAETFVCKDDINQRLYIVSGGNTGFCIDLRSWTKLADVDSMLCFDPSKGELYQSIHYFNAENSTFYDEPIAVSKIPSTAELVRLGREIIGQP